MRPVKHGRPWPDPAMPSWPVPAMRRPRLPQLPIRMKTTTSTLYMNARLNGPPRSANGGFASGTFADAVGGTASVRLLRPIPLASPLEVELDDEGLSALVVDSRRQHLAEVSHVEPFTMPPPVRPGFGDAEAAREASPLHGAHHLLSSCVVCGPGRRDGLHVTPGPLANRADVLAAPFVPSERDATDGVVHPAAIWGALDCPSYPAAALRAGRIGLLGTLTAHRTRDAFLGERLVVVGWTLERHGRSTETASALLDERGGVVASARSVWIELRHQGLVRLAGRFRRPVAKLSRAGSPESVR